MIRLNPKTILIKSLLAGGIACFDVIAFLILRRGLHADLTAAVMLSALLSVLFAFVVISIAGGISTPDDMKSLAESVSRFFAGNLWAMGVQVFGMILLCSVWGAREGRTLVLLIAAMIPVYIIISLHKNYLQEYRNLTGKTLMGSGTASADTAGRRYFAGGFLLSVLIAGVGFIIHGVWPFGDKTVLIVDSLHQYLPFYTDFQQKLENSSSLLYSFSGGLGYNFWSTYAYYLASPLNLLMVFFPMQYVCDFMDFIILFKIGLCGGIFSWYLHQRNPGKRFLPVAFGAAYALSNFVIGYYFNLMWLDSIAVVPLIMLGIERIVSGRKSIMFCMALFYGLWCNYYIGFMLCFFSCLYYVVCLVSEEQITWEKVLKSALRFAWYALLAGGMAAVLLVPSYVGLSASESMQDNHFPSVIKFYTSLTEMMMNHFILSEPINIADTQVGLNAYCSVAAVPMAVLYLLCRKRKLRERLAHLAITSFLLLSFSLNILNYIWHGFHVQNGLPNRFAFLYILMLLVMAYDALEDVTEYRLYEILISFLLPVGFAVYVWRSGVADGHLELHQIFLTIGILLIWMGALLMGRFKVIPDGKALFSAILTGMLIVELSVNGIYGILQNGGVTRSLYLADQHSWKRLIADQEDPTFYRSEVDRSRMRNVTMFVGGKGMVMFNSTMQESVIRLCDSLGIEARTNKNGYLGVTKLINDVFGIKYMATPSSLGDSMYQFRRLASDGELTLFKNDNALSIGFVVNDDIRNWNIDQSEPLDVQNEFVALATGHEPIFVLDRIIDMEDGENYGIKIPENKQVYLCLDTRVAKIELETPEYNKTYNDFTDHLYVINGLADNNYADFTVTLKSSQTTVPAEVYTCANAEYEEVISELHKSQLTDVQLPAANHLTGHLDAVEAGTLLLTIPYDKGWTIRVDGEVTEPLVIGKALMGVPVTAGEHQVDLKYIAPGLGTGTILSLIALLLFLVTMLLSARAEVRRNQGLEMAGSEDASAAGGNLPGPTDWMKQMPADGLRDLDAETPDQSMDARMSGEGQADSPVQTLSDEPASAEPVQSSSRMDQFMNRAMDEHFEDDQFEDDLPENFSEDDPDYYFDEALEDEASMDAYKDMLVERKNEE